MNMNMYVYTYINIYVYTYINIINHHSTFEVFKKTVPKVRFHAPLELDIAGDFGAAECEAPMFQGISPSIDV